MATTKNNIDTSYKHNVKQKKPDIKKILYNSIYINFKNKEN